MARWSRALEGSIYRVAEEEKERHFLKSFFENRAFIPKTEQEKKEFDDFSFVSSAMSLLVYIARVDGEISGIERETIMKELLYQFEQRPFEYKVLAEKFAANDREILNKLFHKFEDELERNICNLDEIIRIINMIYQNNPYKRYFLIRLCYYVAFADRKFSYEEIEAIKKLAKKLDIDEQERLRIEKEVKDSSIQ
ncbi:MAG: TerB family tellurite resistance protein [Candidatus Cloacimonadia bacterium]